MTVKDSIDIARAVPISTIDQTADRDKSTQTSKNFILNSLLKKTKLLPARRTKPGAGHISASNSSQRQERPHGLELHRPSAAIQPGYKAIHKDQHSEVNYLIGAPSMGRELCNSHLGEA